MNCLVKKCKKKLIFSSIVLILIVSLFFRGYFSEGVSKIITTQAKLSSQEYIGRILKEEITDEEYKLFYDSVSTEGIVITSFDVNRANLLLSNTMDLLKDISSNFNKESSFKVDIPISYLFTDTAYFFPSISLNVETSTLLYYEAKIKTDIKEYGINSSLVSLFLTVDIKYQVIVPLMFEVVENTIDIPLAIEVINGKIPDGLFNFR